MTNLSSIQITKEFKEVLRREKQNNESFEDYLKRLKNQKSSIEQSIDDSIENHNEFKKEIVAPQTDFIEKEDPNIIADGEDQFGTPTVIRQIKKNQEIKIIPKDPIKILEHQQDYFPAQKEIEETPVKPCEEHNLPAQYDSFSKKWLCFECRQLENLNPTLKIPY